MKLLIVLILGILLAVAMTLLVRGNMSRDETFSCMLVAATASTLTSVTLWLL